MPAFICDQCRREIRSTYEQFSERMEYRRLDAKERRLTFAVRDICRDCVDEIKAQRKHTVGEQGSLW